MRRWIRGGALGATIAACGALLTLTPLGDALERSYGLGWLFQIRGTVEPPPEVVVVGIDGTTGAALGHPRLPRDWPRTLHAEVVERLVEGGARVIVFDVDFSRVKPGDEDRVLAGAIAEADRVMLYERFVGRRQPLQSADGNVVGWTWIEERQPPNPELAGAARAIGSFPLPKVDHAAFEFWAFKTSAGYAPTTAAIAVQMYAFDVYGPWLELLRQVGAKGIEDLPRTAEEIGGPAELEAAMLTLRRAFISDPGLRARVGAALGPPPAAGGESRERRLMRALTALYAGDDQRYLNFYGPAGTLARVPYHDLLDGNAAVNGARIGELRDKVVFVGYSDLHDPDQPDRFYTVFTGRDGIDLSGVEVMATAFANLLTDRTLEVAPDAIAVALVVAFGLAVGVIAYLVPAPLAVPLAVLLTCMYGTAVAIQFNLGDLWLPLATPLMVQLPAALLMGITGQYLLERRKERKISRAISYYLPENVVRDLTETDLDPSSLNKVVYGTCLATDMAGFTTLAEASTPEELATFMNAYFDALAEPLKRHAADVTEFHADTIMCAWTGSSSDLGLRRRAVLAALGVVEAIERFNEFHGNLALKPRIGLQDGHLYIGHTGGGGRMAYSILGDPANTAARLESVNKQLGTRVLAAASVVSGLDGLLVRPLGEFRFVGKEGATAVVEVLGRSDAADADRLELCARFAEALAALRAGDFANAGAAFEALLERHPDDGPSRYYANHCRRCAHDGVPDGDPTVIRLDVK
jgi:adenylate cyclase